MSIRSKIAPLVRTSLASTTVIAVLLGFGGCTSESADTPRPTAAAPADDARSDNDPQTAAAQEVDRASLPWNDEVPAEFPLEDIPLPAKGTLDYAKLVEDDVWNVMISNVPQAEHEDWIARMSDRFKAMDDSGMKYLARLPNGAGYIVSAMIFDRTDDGLILAYRISVMKRS